MHVALLPNGKVPAYDSIGDNATETYPVQDHTRATVWDPATGTQTPVNVDTGFNVFCSGLAHLVDGRVFLAAETRTSSSTASSRLTSSIPERTRGASVPIWRLGAGIRP